MGAFRKMNQYKFQWGIVRAGPAGIAAVGRLLDAGISKKDILWVDPHFKSGDLGAVWSNVSSNTSVGLFFDFFAECESFEFNKAPKFAIHGLDTNETCQLKYVTEPLNWLTGHLCQKVQSCKDFVRKVSMSERHWLIETKTSEKFYAKNVILATGSEQHSLELKGVDEIPLKIALNKEKLKDAVEGKEKVAVFGSSHSAILLLRDLLDLGVKDVRNFYLDALRYAVFLEDWVLFDDTGLKGTAAQWARKKLHGALPAGLNRYLSTEENLKKHFYGCDAVIYATGFRRRKIKIEGLKPDFQYNPHCGIIAPGLFGVGIGFPERVIDRYGHQEYSVGLWKFIAYLKSVLPLWLEYGL